MKPSLITFLGAGRGIQDEETIDTTIKKKKTFIYFDVFMSVDLMHGLLFNSYGFGKKEVGADVDHQVSPLRIMIGLIGGSLFYKFCTVVGLHERITQFQRSEFVQRVIAYEIKFIPEVFVYGCLTCIQHVFS